MTDDRIQATLAPARARIDAVDAQIVALLGQRIAIVREVIDAKDRAAIPARLEDRIEAVVAHVRAEAPAHGCPPDLAETVWRAMIEWTIGFEERQLSGPDGQPAGTASGAGAPRAREGKST